jgi:HEAT repeat protein
MPSLTLDPRIVDLLTRDLQHADPETRETALDRLGVCFGDHANLIAASLDDPEPEVRTSAAANLGELRRLNAWPHLVRSVREERSGEVCRHIVLALEGYTDQAILDVLLEVLGQRERDYRIRLNAVSQLWKYHPALVAPSLEAVVMSDDHPLVRLHAAGSLELIDALLPFEPSRRALWLRLRDNEDVGISGIAATALRSMEEAPPASLEDLLGRRLHGSDVTERSIAVGRLSLLAADVALALAKPLLAASQPGIRAGCCHCLGAIRDNAAVPLLAAAIRSDPELRVRTAAVVSLGNYHTVQVGELLLDLLEAESLEGEARSFLCGQLWRYPSERTASLLQRVLDSPQPVPEREHVMGALAFLDRLVHWQA